MQIILILWYPRFCSGGIPDPPYTLHYAQATGFIVMKNKNIGKTRASESSLIDIVSRLSDGIIQTDGDGRIIEWSRDSELVTGIPASEAVGEFLWEIQYSLIPEQDKTSETLEKLKHGFLNILNSKKGSIQEAGWEAKIQHRNGNLRSLHMLFFPVKKEMEKSLVGILLDVTENKNADQQVSVKDTALESAANGIAITNNKGEILWVNPAFKKLTGYEIEEVRGKTFRILKSGKQNETDYHDLWNTILKGQVWRGELVNRKKDGTLFTEEQTITPVKDENGDITHFIAIMEDITETKKLQGTEARFSEVLENIKLAAVMLESEGNILYCNKFFLDLTGWTRNEILDKNWFEHVLPEEGREREIRIFQEGVTSHHENEILTVEGEKRTIAWNITFTRDQEGSIEGITSIGEDITQKKQAEKEIARLAAVVEQVAEGVMITDKEKEIIYVNPYFQTLTGYSREDLIGQDFRKLQMDEDYANIYNAVWDNVSKGKNWHGNLVHFRKDGSLYHEETNIFPIRNHSGEVINFAAISRDVTDRVEAEEQIQLQLRRLAALRTIDLAITSSLDIRVVINVLLDQVVTQLEVDAAAFLLLNPHTQILEYAGGRGFRKSSIDQSHLQLGQGLAGQVAFERQPVSIPNLSQVQDQYTRGTLIAGEDFVAYHAVPLVAKGQVKGVLEIYNRQFIPPNPEWERFLETLAGQAAIAIDNAAMLADLQRSNEELTQAYVTTLDGWVRTLGLRDFETEDHTHRVTNMTLRLAEAVGISDSDMVHIRRGALLHDIGKMAVPDHILLKTGPLDDQEWSIMRRHPQDAYQLLFPIAYLRPALEIPYCHHEKWNGRGYPRGLRADEIPISARLFAIADVWDALLSDRPYRRAWPEEKAIEYLRDQSGRHFDPHVLEVFLDTCLNNGH
jgi:PAS domain S-box-containing protein/putative nucleotidyltransferase with HDIG domain